MDEEVFCCESTPHIPQHVMMICFGWRWLLLDTIAYLLLTAMWLSMDNIHVAIDGDFAQSNMADMDSPHSLWWPAMGIGGHSTHCILTDNIYKTIRQVCQCA